MPQIYRLVRVSRAVCRFISSEGRSCPGDISTLESIDLLPGNEMRMARQMWLVSIKIEKRGLTSFRPASGELYHTNLSDKHLLMLAIAGHEIWQTEAGRFRCDAWNRMTGLRESVIHQYTILALQRL